MKTININGQDYTIEELTTILENAKKSNPMDEVYAYHNTTEEAFNEMYKNIPPHIKAIAQESLIAAFYNKGWTPDWDDLEEEKYYPYFEMDFISLHSFSYHWHYSEATSPTYLAWKNKDDLTEAVEKFFEIFKTSRTLCG